MKVLPAQCPCNWMTSNRTPHSRYSSVPPMRRLWPLRFGRLNRFASLLIFPVSSLLLRGCCLLLEWVQEKRCSFGATALMQKWFFSTAMGSVGPFCWTHWTDSPFPDALEVLVQGRWNLKTNKLFQSVTCERPARVMCLAGLKALMLGTVNSPTLAMCQDWFFTDLIFQGVRGSGYSLVVRLKGYVV